LPPFREEIDEAKKTEPEKTATSSAPNSAGIVAEPVRKVLKSSAPVGSARKTSAFSINAALQTVEAKTEEEKPAKKEDVPAQHFTETDLQNEWQSFLQSLQARDAIIFNAVGSFKLLKKDEKTVQVTYPSESARAEFEKVRTEFFNHFMHKVNNYSIVVEFTVDVTMKKEIMTKRKIFDKFAEINPVLRDLDEAFKLDFN